ncbi:nucleotidyltransferase domain-containing protein [Caloramator sp. E03]|uniref:type VII toxin-antitoxin system MntA family adenylyltransferase antitoxin n=1 Tax=Caloramator sp. E03 TaxID=2576307 RepID=UPI001110837A|nr:nucleotidyltransferase domain-containing protein [Caloramator sp. E03]QCX34346.1 nucleotidyltransferase domain-containing protein [Caloramator sp. E03]
MDGIIKSKIDEFLKKAQEICEINFAYIFGSYARGEQNENSDIDIAIMPQKNYDDIEEVFIRGNLIEIGKEVFKKDVDVVFLNIDSIFLKYEIIRDGIVIKDSIDRISYESLVIRKYLDFKYYSDYYNEVILNSIKAKNRGV